MGTNLVEFYLRKGWEVKNFDIAEPQNSDHLVYWTKGNILNYEEYENAIQSFAPDYFVHLAARTDLLENKDLINGYAENIKGVEFTIAICKKVKSLKRVLFASSRMVCKIDYIPKNYDDYCPPNFYGLSKVIGERLIKNASLEKEWVIFRPTSIWGPWFDSPYIIFFRMIQRRLFYKVIGHDPQKSFGYIGNSVYQISKLIDSEVTHVSGQTFYLCDYPPLKLNRWASMINSEFGRNTLISLPKVMLVPLAKIGDFLLKLGWNRVPITSFRLNNLIAEMVYPTDKLKEICGELPFDLESGVKETVSWMKKHKNRDKLAGKRMN